MTSCELAQDPDTAPGTVDRDEPAPDAVPRRSRRWPGRRAVGLAAGAVVTAGLIATITVLASDLYERRAVEHAEQQALAAAQQYAAILTSVDSAHLDENFEAVLDGATGEFKKMYSESSNHLKQLLIDNDAKPDGKVVAAGIKSASRDRVEVMLFVDQEVSNKHLPEPRLDRSRIIMTMNKVDGRWLAGDVVVP